jgi:hypothetical protein
MQIMARPIRLGEAATAKQDASATNRSGTNPHAMLVKHEAPSALRAAGRLGSSIVFRGRPAIMTSPAKSDSKDVPVTSAAEVRHLAGPLNDDAVAAILRVGPSLAELEIASRYVRGEGDLVDRAGHPLSGRVGQIYEIIAAEEADEDEGLVQR